MALHRNPMSRQPAGRRVLLALMLFAACAPAVRASNPAEAPPKVSIEGSSLRVDYADGTSLRGQQLVGKEIQIGQAGAPMRLRIDAVTEDERMPEVWLHQISAQGSDGQWQNICSADADGRQLAVPLAGFIGPDGGFVADPAKLSIACTSGAQGKCLRFGYRYWMNGSTGESLLPQFQACLRMVRADYCGDGRSWTRNGMAIDMYDDVGVQFPEKNKAMPFEAGWSPEGAVCVHHSRVTENLALQELKQQCPRLASVSGKQCTESWARTKGKAVLYNRSRQ